MVQMLKGGYIIFEGQYLYPLLRIVIKINGIRFGIVFAFHPNLSETPALLWERKTICSFFLALNTCSFTQSINLCCTLTICQTLDLTQDMHW